MTDLDRIEAVFKSGQLSVVSRGTPGMFCFCSSMSCLSCISVIQEQIEGSLCNGMIDEEDLLEFYNKFPEARLI